ncbi:MAG: MFS transporter [Novosphingobium sp.]|nr:MFS transporter [Novosphingobium sp.]MCP5403355.1 MFS transporter [Novosphingobium sp.]
MARKFALGWRQVGACLILMAACGMIATTYSVIAVPLAEEFQPSRMVLMLAMTVMALVTALVSPPLGSLMDRLSMRLMTGLGVGFIVAGYFALSFTTSFLQAIIIFGLLMGPAQVLLGPMAGTVLLSRWFVERRGRALGIAIAGVALGGFIFPPVIQGLLGQFDWRVALRLLSLILLVCTVPAVFLIVNRPSDRGLHPDGAATAPVSAGNHADTPPASSRAILSDPAFWIAGILFAVVPSGMMGMVTSLMPLATDEGVDPTAAALLISVYAASGFIAKLSFAAVADRLHPRALLFLSLVGFALGMACLILAEAGIWMIGCGVVLIGLFGGLMIPTQSFLIPRIFGERVIGRASGLIQVLVLAILLLTPPTFGLIFDLTGNYDAIFIVFTALAAGSLLLVPYLRLHPRVAPPAMTMAAQEPVAAE